MQIDACRVAGVNENIANLLLAAKFGVPVCPHAGGVGLCEIVLRLRRPAAGELHVDDGVEAAAEQRLGGLLHHFRICQGLPRRAQCGIGAVQREICAGHVVDQLLMRRRERHVSGDRKLACRLDRS